MELESQGYFATRAHFLRRAADLLIDPLENLGQGKLDVLADALDLGQTLRADPVDKGHQGVFVQPCGRLREGGYRRQISRSGGGAQVAEDIHLVEAGGAVIRQLHGKQPFVNDLSETIHDPCPVEIEARRRFMRQGMEAGAPDKGVLAEIKTVPALCWNLSKGHFAMMN